ncbi:hypothetical protein B0H13DRAFT_2333065 [Mycena leptocephala]|nr:hypothetical protein B0H13DRAFT_2333065 [Mycena leptocephala]
MRPPPPPPANPRKQLVAAITTVEKLLDYQLPPLMDNLNEEVAANHVWVRVVAKTPQQVEAEHEAVPHGSRPWWVVFIGREPGLYTTIEQADLQIKGCPNQQYRRKSSKFEALSFYRLMHDNNKVEKWVELPE